MPCDRRMPLKLEGKLYRAVFRPAMINVAETWATTKVKRLEVNEMRMLRWMCGVTLTKLS